MSPLFLVIGSILVHSSILSAHPRLRIGYLLYHMLMRVLGGLLPVALKRTIGQN